MGQLVYFEDHFPDKGAALLPKHQLKRDGLIPLQLALNECNIEKCLAMTAQFAECPIYPRSNADDAGRFMFLVKVEDAIALNQYLIELEADDELLAERIDHLQMLENCEDSLISKAWERFGPSRTDAPRRPNAGQEAAR